MSVVSLGSICRVGWVSVLLVLFLVLEDCGCYVQVCWIVSFECCRWGLFYFVVYFSLPFASSFVDLVWMCEFGFFEISGRSRLSVVGRMLIL